MRAGATSGESFRGDEDGAAWFRPDPCPTVT